MSRQFRRLTLVVAMLLLMAACAPIEDDSAAQGTAAGRTAVVDASSLSSPAPTAMEGTASAPSLSCEPDDLELTRPGTLTAGTSYPYYAPFKKGPREAPEGFEPDLVEALAERLGLSEVVWETAPFDSLYAPGQKPYDFSIDQISITPERAEVVNFSQPYYTIQQGLLVREGEPIGDASTIDGLRGFKFGAQTGTTGLTYIKDVIQPDTPPNEYNDTNDAAQALAVGQIDGVVIDVPIALPLTEQFPGTTVSAQFPTEEGYGMAFQEQSNLLDCIDSELASMIEEGRLDELQNTWLPELNVEIPVIEP